MKKLLALALLMCGVTVRADVRGTAVTPEGAPLAGARVELFAVKSAPSDIDAMFTPDEPLATIATDAKGNFRLASKAGNYTLRITGDGYAPAGMVTTGDEDLGGILMRPAAKKIGRVTAGGKPLAEVRVSFVAPDTRLDVRTGADGRYSVPDPDVWKASVRAYHPGYALHEQRMDIGDPPVQLDIAMKNGVTLRGRVLAADAKSGTSAKLFVDGLAEGETADDGTFELQHVRDEWRELAAVSGDLVAKAGRTRLGSMRLQKAITLRGTVIDSTSRVAVRGAVVALIFDAQNPSLAVSVVSDEKGRFAIPSLLPGAYSLNVSAAGYGTTRVSQSVLAETQPRSIYLQRDIRVSGTITDGERNPVSAASVRVVPRRRNVYFTEPNTQVSAPDGRYALHVSPSRAESGDLDVEVARSGRATVRNGPHVLRSGEEKTINIVMTAGIALTGRVTNADGEPLRGVSIASRPSGSASSAAMAFIDTDWSTLPFTGDDGRFTLPLQPGSYDLLFRLGGYATAVQREVEVKHGAAPVEVKLEPGVSISGTVVDANDAAVAGATVHAVVAGPPVTATTDSQGRFALNGLATGRVELYVYNDSEEGEQRTINAPGENVRIELPATITASGRVMTKDDRAVSDFTVEITPQQQGMTYYGTFGRKESFHDAEGRFVVDRIAARPSDLVVRAPGYVPARIPLKVEAEKDIENIEVKLDRAGTVSGRISGPTGAPLEGVLVREKPSGNVVWIDWDPVRTDADGEYRVGELATGSTTIQYSKDGYQELTKSIVVDGSERRVDVQMQRGKTISGRVITESGAPVADAQVRAQADTQAVAPRAGSTDAAGRFTINGLAGGIYVVSATRSGLVDAELPNVDADKGDEITLVMSNGATITGRVSGIDPAMYPKTSVSVRLQRKRPMNVPIDSTGVYRAEGVPEGKVDVLATYRGTSTRSTDVVDVETRNGRTTIANLEFKEYNTVRGRVTRRGVPLRSGFIVFWTVPPRTNASGAIDGDGNYEIEGVRSGEQRIVVRDNTTDTTYTVMRTVTGSQTLDIDLNPATLSGRVVDETTGEPIADATIVLAPKTTADFGGSRIESKTGADGRLLIDNITPGEYDVRVSKERFASVAIRRSLREGVTDDLQVRLMPAAGLTLRVIDGRSGQAISAFVSARQLRTVAFSGFLNAGPDGAVNVPVAPGSYRFDVHATGLASVHFDATAPGSQSVTLRPGGTLEVNASKGSLRGVILGSDGSPYDVTPGTQTYDFAIQSGTVISDIAPGAYTLQVLDTDRGATTSVPFVIRTGEKTRLDL